MGSRLCCIEGTPSSAEASAEASEGAVVADADVALATDLTLGISVSVLTGLAHGPILIHHPKDVTANAAQNRSQAHGLPLRLLQPSVARDPAMTGSFAPSNTP